MKYIKVTAEATIKVQDNLTEEQLEQIKLDTFITCPNELIDENYSFQDTE